MTKKKTLRDMTTTATVLGWPLAKEQSDWPESFEARMTWWHLDHVTVAKQTGEIQCAEYRDGNEWLIVTNE